MKLAQNTTESIAASPTHLARGRVAFVVERIVESAICRAREVEKELDRERLTDDDVLAAMTLATRIRDDLNILAALLDKGPRA